MTSVEDAVRLPLLISLILLWAVPTFADSLLVGTPAVISTNNGGAPISIPRNHTDVNHTDSLERWFVHGRYIFRTTDEWTTKDSIRLVLFLNDGHENLTVIIEDSILAISGGNGTVEVLHATARTPVGSGPTGLYRGVLFGDTINEQTWALYRGTSAANFDYNFAYSQSTNGGISWTAPKWLDSLVHDGRISVMKYPSGYPAAIIMDFTDGLVKYRYATSLTAWTVNADSMIDNSMSWTANERVFDNGMYVLSDGDTATFLLNARDSTLVLLHKSFAGGAGSWIIDTIFQNYTTGFGEYEVAIGQIFDMVTFTWCVDTSGTNSRAVYMSWWCVDGDTIATPRIISASGDTLLAGTTLIAYNPFHTGEIFYYDATATQLIRVPITLVEVSAGADTYEGQVILIGRQ